MRLKRTANFVSESYLFFFRSVLNRVAELASVMSPFGVIPCRPIQIFIDSFGNERI